MRLSCPSLLVALVVLVPACGGSSSETPPPLEPDFDRMAAQQEQSHLVQQGGAPEPGSRAPAQGDDVVEAAPSTWGGPDGGARPPRTRR